MYNKRTTNCGYNIIKTCWKFRLKEIMRKIMSYIVERFSDIVRSTEYSTKLLFASNFQNACGLTKEFKGEGQFGGSIKHMCFDRHQENVNL